jgi:hypothetical protein
VHSSRAAVRAEAAVDEEGRQAVAELGHLFVEVGRQWTQRCCSVFDFPIKDQALNLSSFCFFSLFEITR